MKALVQLERITFRAVLILLLRTALFLCSECDTFLMNYNMNNRYLIDKKGQIMIFSHYLTSLLVYRI